MNKAQQAIKAISDSVFEAGEKTELALLQHFGKSVAHLF